MKPTRNIVKPNNGLWKTKGSVWYQKNDDETGHLNKYKDRPAQTYLDGIGWVRDSNLSSPVIQEEIERIKQRGNKK